MAPTDTESQFKFLIACIKHTNAGKVDFGKVAEELSIVSKAAAAKRYERLMKSHGIEKSSSGGASGPSTPKAKNASKSTTPASKKRKIAARGDDVDEDDDVKPDIKPDIKDEVKQEESATITDGSCITDPNHPQIVTAAVDTLVKTADGDENFGDRNDDVLLISESRRVDSAAHVAYSHRVLLPPPTESPYGFVDPAINVHHLPQHPVAGTNVPIQHDYGHADYAMQTMTAFPLDGRHWLHHHKPVFFWGDAPVEPHVNIKHD